MSKILEFRLWPDKTKFAVEASQISAIAEGTTPDKKKKLTIIYIGVGMSEYIQVPDKYQEVLATWQESKDEEELEQQIIFTPEKEIHDELNEKNGADPVPSGGLADDSGDDSLRDDAVDGQEP